MTNKFLELSKKRKEQSDLAAKISQNHERLKNMSDEDVRNYNLAEQVQSDIIIKKNISFAGAYNFACEYRNDTGENILNEPVYLDKNIGGVDVMGKTLLYTYRITAHLINNRKMTSEQYACYEKVADMMLSGDYNHYHSVQFFVPKKSKTA